MIINFTQEDNGYLEIGDFVKTDDGLYMIVQDSGSELIGLLNVENGYVDLRYNHEVHVLNHFNKRGEFKIIKGDRVSLNIGL